ncbi:CGNR zinc finger domain-containing protein [Occallatibacter savannae]|uniref:CGNR zinc finger domain-containing protein n=1 Tax=Occallatibacter savannae TaxID=1002691 RepID=UPI000D697A0F|nr:CGNR zinc finger domain-containing protein [Occallatibacter savannae]
MEKGSAALQERKDRAFDLSGGHPALDLVNTLDWRFRESGPEELLADYSDVLRFCEQSAVLTSMEARRLVRTVPESKGAKVLAQIRELREAAAELFYAAIEGTSPAQSSVRRLEEYFAPARAKQTTRWTGEKLEWVLEQTSEAACPLWLLSLKTAELATSEQMSLARQCGSEECRWLFIDTSKNHTRRWCNMKICGNRMKARRYKAQH